MIDLGLLTLAGLALAFVVGLPVLCLRLRSTVRGLEARVRLLEAGAARWMAAGDERATDSADQGIAGAPARVGPWTRAAPPPEAPGVAAEAGAAPEPPLHPRAPADPPIEPEKGRLVLALMWLRANRLQVIAAVSLALAGLSAARYAAERGMLGPEARVLLAGLFGFALIGAGEALRRRGGDDPAAAHLPSVFGTAGLVTLFGAIATARLAHGLIGPGTALGLMASVCAGAIALGWLYGPFLAAGGVLGGVAAPFLTGGDPDGVAVVLAYWALIGATGVAINRVRRWPWITELSLSAPFAAGGLVALSFADGAGFGLEASRWALAQFAGVNLFALAFAALTVVGARAEPKSAVLQAVANAPPAKPANARAIGRAFLLAFVVALPMIAGQAGLIASALGVVGLTLMGLLSAFASNDRRRARGFDLAVLASGGLVALLATSPWLLPGAEVRDLLTPEPGDFFGFERSWGFGLIGVLATGVVGLGLVAWAAARRSAPSRSARAWRGWAVLAASVGPAGLTAIEAARSPGTIEPDLGAAWAFTVLAAAALSCLAAVRADRADGGERLRAGLAAVGGFYLLGLALFVTLTEAALIPALGVLALAAVAADRRFDLPPLRYAVQAAAWVAVYRAVVDPGVLWALTASAWALAALLGAAALLLGARLLAGGIGGRGAATAKVSLENGAAILAAVALSAAVLRQVGVSSVDAGAMGHGAAGLIAGLWWLIAVGNVRALVLAKGESGSAHRALRVAAALVAALTGAGFAALALTAFNPVLSPWGATHGPPLFGTLLPGYAWPALVLAAGAWLLGGRWRWRLGLPAAALGAVHLGLSVAQAWRGPLPYGQPVGAGELWSYSALIIGIGAAALTLGHRSGSRGLRRAGNAVLAAAIFKVFVVDAADLEGLARAASFLALGLALAGLAWLHKAEPRGREPPA